MKINKGYIIGKGNEFFGLEFEDKLNNFLNSLNDISQNSFQLITSLDEVSNVKIFPKNSFEEQNEFKKLYPKYDSIAKELNIKTKHITDVIDTKYRFKDTTLITSVLKKTIEGE